MHNWNYRLADTMLMETCPACAYHVAVPFYDGGRQPLTTLAWPTSAAEAKTMEHLPLAFVRCVSCGHVYNKDFDYTKVPYSSKPNLMFNKGALWRNYLHDMRDRLLALLPEHPVVIEIGCGDGHFLKSLADARPEGRYIGFDPNASIHVENGNIEARACLFEAEHHMAEYKPDLIISRHVLEHLMNPLGFVQSLSYAAAWHDVKPLLYIEVPCIDRVFSTGRTADFFYEHNSHFTTQSLTSLLQRCGTDVKVIDRGYDDEVVYGFATLGANTEHVAMAREALNFRDTAVKVDNTVRTQLSHLTASGKTTAVWGGTGKAAAFINRYHVDAERFPVVVDSDRDKLGTYVPGMGQEIRSPEVLKANPVQVVIIATQWRARDIVIEMEGLGLTPEKILLEYRGQLVDYHQDEHPYKYEPAPAVNKLATAP